MSQTPIFDVGKALTIAAAKAEPVAPAPKGTSVAFDVAVAGQVKTFGLEVATQHVGERLAWSAAGWVKVTTGPGGFSAGGTGKVSF